MKVYLLYIKNVVKQGFTYKFNHMMKLSSVFLKIVIQYFIWRALLKNNSFETSAGDIEFEIMIPYMVVSNVMQVAMVSSTISNINNKIRTGTIATDLMKPISFAWICFGESLGQMMYQMLFLLLPINLMATLTIGFKLPDFICTVIFLISFLNSFVMLFLIRFLLGLMGFWFTQVWVLERFLNDFIKLFSGVFVPIWFFPEWLQKISNILPFKYLYYAPISIFIEVVDGMGAFKIIVYQFVWILVFYILGRLVWKKAIDVITILGG